MELYLHDYVAVSITSTDYWQGILPVEFQQQRSADTDIQINKMCVKTLQPSAVNVKYANILLPIQPI